MFGKKKAKKQKPVPLCYKPWKNPVRFATTKVHMLSMAAIGTYIGVLIVAALYYLLLQTTVWTNDMWHQLVPQSDTRHMIRNVGEGLLGGLLGQALIWNHYKKRGKPKIWDKIEMKLHIPNIHDGKWSGPVVMLLTPLLCLAYAIPGYLLGSWFIHMVHEVYGWYSQYGYSETANAVTPGMGHRAEGVITQDYDQKVIGYAAAFFFGRHPAKGVMDDIQEYLVTYRICREGSLHWYHSPTYKARFNEMSESGVNKKILGSWQTKLIRGGVAVGVILAAFGFFVLNYIAYGLVDQDIVNKYANIAMIAFVAVVLLPGVSVLTWVVRKSKKTLQHAM